MKQFSVSSQFDFSKLLEDLRAIDGSTGTRMEERYGYKLIYSQKNFPYSIGPASVSLSFKKENDGYEANVLVTSADYGKCNLHLGTREKYSNEICKILINLGALIK